MWIIQFPEFWKKAGLPSVGSLNLHIPDIPGVEALERGADFGTALPPDSRSRKVSEPFVVAFRLSEN